MSRLTLALLVAWWALYPLLPRMQASLWFVHLGVVAALALLAVPRLWRAPRVTLGVPFACTALVAVSVLIAARREPELLPLPERWWATLTVLGHGLWFLAALVHVPRLAGATGGASVDARGDGSTHGPNDARAEDAEARRVRLGLAGVLGLLLLVQTVAALVDLGETRRLAGSLGNPNVFGACMAAAALALAACLRWPRVVLLVLLGVGALLLATRSRGALAAALLVVGAFAARRSVRSVVVLLVGVGVVLVVVPNPLVERVLSMREEASYSRTFLWSTAAGLIPDNPWGLGPAMYKYSFPALALDPSAPWLVHQRHAIGLTHNVVLTLVVEGGWLAGLAGGAFLVWALLRACRGRVPDALGQAGLLGAAVLAIEAQVDAVEQNPLVFSLLLFLGAVALRRLPGERVGLPVPGRVAAALLAVAALALAGAAGARWPGQRLNLQAGDAVRAWRQGQGSRATAEAALERAMAALPDEAGPAKALFELRFGELRTDVLAGAPWAEQSERVAACQAAIDVACRANPADPRLERLRADLALMVWRRGGRGRAAFEAYRASAETVLALDPLDAVTRRELAQEAQRQGLPDLAREHLDALFELEPDDAFAWLVTATLAERAGQGEQALYAWIRAREAVFNARIKSAVDDPGAQAYFRDILGRADLDLIRKRISSLRRELY